MMRSGLALGVLILCGLWQVTRSRAPAGAGALKTVHQDVGSRPIDLTHAEADIVEHFYDSGPLKSRSQVSHGVLNGLSEGWYTNGVLHVTEYFDHGVSHGLRTKWYPDGSKKSEAHIVQGRLDGLYVEWHATGEKKLEMKMLAGQPEGPATVWHRSGRVKSVVRFEAGKPVDTQHFADTGRLADVRSAASLTDLSMR